MFSLSVSLRFVSFLGSGVFQRKHPNLVDLWLLYVCFFFLKYFRFLILNMIYCYVCIYVCMYVEYDMCM